MRLTKECDRTRYMDNEKNLAPTIDAAFDGTIRG